MNKAKQDSLLGIVFFAALALLLWATFALTDLSFSGEKPRFDVYCANAGGIRSGDPVYLLGNRAGQVSRVEYQRNANTPSLRIKLTLELREELTMRRDAVIEITSPNLLGGKIIEIDPGVAESVWPPNQVLTAKLKTSGLDALGDLLDDEELQDDFKQIISGIRRAVDQINSTDGTIGQLINSTELYESFLSATQSAGRSLAELEKAESPLGRLIYSEEDGAKLSSAIAHVESIATTIDEGQGMLGRIVNDVELANKVETLIDEFAEFATKATDPEAGLIGALIADPELATKGRKFISDLEAIGESLRTGNGMLARLINDEEMGEQLSRVINQVSRAIEDAREAAPIGTFFQVISGAF